MNEADGAIGKLDFLSGGMNPRIGCTWKQMRVFIKECAKAFHDAVPGIKVTCTSGWHEYKNVKAGRFSGLDLDFYDWHSYKNDPNLPHASELKLDKPVIIGECGPKTKKPDANYSLQGKNWQKYVNQASKGYAGLLTWSYGNQGAESNYIMVNADHSWRSGAKFIYQATRGSLIPDAGPLLLTKAEETALKEINEALKSVIKLKDASRPTFSLNAAQKRMFWLGNETEKYFPYINPRYAVHSYIRAIEEIANAGIWELSNRISGYESRVTELKEISKALKASKGTIKSTSLEQAMKQLENFLSQGLSDTPASASPFSSEIIYAH
jgi:hypothetical protein